MKLELYGYYTDLDIRIDQTGRVKTFRRTSARGGVKWFLKIHYMPKDQGKVPEYELVTDQELINGLENIFKQVYYNGKPQ